MMDPMDRTTRLSTTTGSHVLVTGTQRSCKSLGSSFFLDFGERTILRNRTLRGRMSRKYLTVKYATTFNFGGNDNDERLTDSTKAEDHSPRPVLQDPQTDRGC
jgi:hypothetical protein